MLWLLELRYVLDYLENVLIKDLNVSGVTTKIIKVSHLSNTFDSTLKLNINNSVAYNYVKLFRLWNFLEIYLFIKNHTNVWYIYSKFSAVVYTSNKNFKIIWKLWNNTLNLKFIHICMYWYYVMGIKLTGSSNYMVPISNIFKIKKANVGCLVKDKSEWGQIFNKIDMVVIRN
jgi:hypothetical protein